MRLRIHIKYNCFGGQNAISTEKKNIWAHRTQIKSQCLFFAFENITHTIHQKNTMTTQQQIPYAHALHFLSIFRLLRELPVLSHQPTTAGLNKIDIAIAIKLIDVSNIRNCVRSEWNKKKATK